MTAIDVQEWVPVTLKSIMIKVDNTPYLNEVDKLNSGLLHIYVKDTGLYDGHHIVQTYIGTDCEERFFYLNFTDIDAAIPPENGVISLTPFETEPQPVDPEPQPLPQPQPSDGSSSNSKRLAVGVFLGLSLLIVAIYIRNK